jgi:predicted nucleotidyltransferase
MDVTRSTHIYRAAARLLTQTILKSPIVRSVYIRRSVAAGEALFPFSDLDLALIIHPASGAEIDQLRRQYRMARILFPRLGECQVFTQDDLDELARTDPYRSSLDRRQAVPIFGPPPSIPSEPIPPTEMARRLVFWFDSYVATALRQRNRRNLHKFALEMANALGVLEGRWPEPLLSRQQTAERCPVPRDQAFAACCQFAARAHALLRPPAPKLSRPLQLPGLCILPSPQDPPPQTGVRVMTPEVLDLLLQTQNPWLWRDYGDALSAAGFQPPSPHAWHSAARRYCGGERLRGPGFSESGAANAFARLRSASSILTPRTVGLPSESPSLSEYYLHHYDRLCALAQTLRAAACQAASPPPHSTPCDPASA